MNKLKDYLFKNFESVFILIILVSVSLVNYFVYSKVAFLNFYYLPIMVAGYYLGKRLAVLGAFLTGLMVWVFVLVDENKFISQSGSFDLYFNLTVWMCFLILAGWLIGSVSEKFKQEHEKSLQLQKDLAQEKELLSVSNQQLHEHTTQLESKVSERTHELERSTRTIETLKSKVEEALYSVMDVHVARMMIEGKLRNEKRRISILFSDLKDFTSYSEEHPPEQVVDELNMYLSEMEEAITKYFGHIDKYMGDGIMVEFGAPIHYQMHSLMAVLAGLSMQERLQQTNSNWQMRIGIATGSAVVGIFGSKRKSYSVIGDTANFASRLEHLCEPGGVFIDEATYLDVKPVIEAERVQSFVGQRTADDTLKNEIETLEAAVQQKPEDVDTLFSLGQAYFRLQHASSAIECFQKVLQLDADNTEAKLAFAEANMKKEEFEKIAIKGKRDRMAVYKVTGLVDPMMNREKIPESFCNKYKEVSTLIETPDDVVLPVESIDGKLLHGRMVAIISYAMAEKLDVSLEEKKYILIAGFLHDMGHAIVPHELLDSSRKLTPNEQDVFKKHPAESVRLIKQMGYHSDVLFKMVEAHHERSDGTGYPHGLKGEEIPLCARILGIADTFDAMTSKRLYAGTWEYKSAIREIEKEAQAGAYDLHCVEVLKELFEV